ncbi:MAG: c-type cytochrome [Vicinamibacterales bacterium]|nr:c-type cytochrome [Vicinamibacterales bacterium]
MPARLLVPIGFLIFIWSPSALLGQAADDLASSRQLYENQCARCHGIDGGGGEGPSLIGRQFSHAADDESLTRIIRNGIPGTAMPGAGWLDEDEAQSLANYVWTLASIEPVPVPGNQALGRILFEGKGECATCHIVNGLGTGLGPELSDIGARRDVRYLRRSLLNPGAVLPRGQLGPHSSFLVVKAEIQDGRTFRGMRVNEDAFVLLLRDQGGNYLTLVKSDTSALEREFGTSFMPDYNELMTEDEIVNLVAYMASLRGNR